MVDFNRLLTNFLTESEGILEESEDAILKLEKDSSPETIDQIFRAVHTIKGNSGLFDLPNIRELSHSMENSLNYYRNHPPDFIPESTIDLYLTTIDRLKTMIGDIKNSNTMEIGDLIKSFQSLNNPGSAQGSEVRENSKVEENSKDSEKHSSSSLLGDNKGAKDWDKNSPPKNLKIGVPRKYMEEAKANKKYLSLVIFNPFAQKISPSLPELVTYIKGKESEGIIKTSSLGELVPDWESAGEGKWKLFFLLQTSEEPSLVLAKWVFSPTSFRILHSPSSMRESKTGLELSSNKPSKLVPKPSEKETTLVPSSAVEAGKDSDKATDISQMDATKDSYLKVSVRLVDDLINLAGEAVIARNELLQKIDSTEDSGLQTSAKKIGTLFSKLQEGIMKTRLQELDSVFQKVPRIVRDISRTTGKEAELLTSGGEVELDKTLIDSISDPIMHMIRNSLDHGIESPEERIQKGKPSKGTIRLAAGLRGGNVIITIEDDGKGLDKERISQKILEKGIMTPEQLALASEEEIFNTIFLPGFSTAEKVTTVSGRCVGMDVVRTNLKKVGGTAEIINRREGGTLVTLTIPQTLSIVTTLLIRTAGRRYAIPEQNVKELILVNPEKLNRVETHLIYNLREHLLPVLDLAKFLNIPTSDDYNPQYLAVLKSEKHSFGILIDEIINPEEIVVKSLGSLFSGLSIFSGATIMGDGETVLILDIPGMAKFWSMQANMEERELQKRAFLKSESQKSKDSRGFLLFLVGSQQFAVAVETVPRIEKINKSKVAHFQNMEVILYRDRSVPLVRLDEFYNLSFEEDLVENDHHKQEMYGIFFKINGKLTGIIATAVERVIGEMPELNKDTYTGDGLMGYAVIEGVRTLFLDIDFLSDKLHKEKFHDLEDLHLAETEVTV